MTTSPRIAFGLALLSFAAVAQQYVISTIAGGASPATPVRGLDMPLNVRGVATDAAGNVYFTSALSCIFKLGPNGIVTLAAGNSRPGYSGDGGPAAGAQLNTPLGMAVDHAGNLFIADTGNHRIRRVSPSGIIVTVAGNGSSGFSGDAGPAVSAQLHFPKALAVDSRGNLFIADRDNHRVRRVSPDGIIVSVAGNGSAGFSGDGGPARSSSVSPDGVAVDSAGDLHIADASNSRVRRVSRDGIITTVAGNGTKGFSGDEGSATRAQLEWPVSVATDGAGNLFIADSRRVRKVSADGIITSLSAGDVNYSFYPTGVAVDGAGNLFVAHNWNYIFKVSPAGSIVAVAGNGTWAFTNVPYRLSPGCGDGGPATSAQLAWPTGVAVDGAGNLFLTDPGRVRKVSPTGIITTVADDGAPGYSSAPGTNDRIPGLFSVAVDDAGNLFFADTYVGFDGSQSGNRVRKVSPAGVITTIAGNGTAGFSGDGGFAASAQLNQPEGVAVDRAGNVYIADTENHAIRVLRPAISGVLISAVVDAASQSANPISPGKIVVIYGAGLGPAQLIRNQPRDGQFGIAAGETLVPFNGIQAPVLYASATQVAAVVLYALGGTMARVTVAYQGLESETFVVPVALSAPSLFTSNQTGAGHAAAINAADGTLNTAANPVSVGGYISLFATGEAKPHRAEWMAGWEARHPPVQCFR